jgi:GT2 family glycosyltransferase
MQVSIVIINYNTYQFTCNCIQSIYDKITGIDFEIILVDNASTECDADLFKQKYPAIILIKSEKNVGFARGNNLGIGVAQGEYILLLNSDTEFISNSIKFIYDKCISLRDVGAATIKLIYPDGAIQSAANYFPNIWLHFLETSRLFRLCKKYYYRKIPVLDYTKDFTADWIWGTFYFFPKKNLTYTEGKLSETFFLYVEDVEWGYLFAKLGLKNYYFSGSAIIHHCGQSSNSKEKRKLINKNHLLFIKKYNGNWSSYVENFLLRVDRYIELLKEKCRL